MVVVVQCCNMTLDYPSLMLSWPWIPVIPQLVYRSSRETKYQWNKIGVKTKPIQHLNTTWTFHCFPSRKEWRVVEKCSYNIIVSQFIAARSYISLIDAITRVTFDPQSDTQSTPHTFLYIVRCFLMTGKNSSYILYYPFFRTLSSSHFLSRVSSIHDINSHFMAYWLGYLWHTLTEAYMNTDATVPCDRDSYSSSDCSQ